MSETFDFFVNQQWSPSDVATWLKDGFRYGHWQPSLYFQGEPKFTVQWLYNQYEKSSNSAQLLFRKGLVQALNHLDLTMERDIAFLKELIFMTQFSQADEAAQYFFEFINSDIQHRDTIQIKADMVHALRVARSSSSKDFHQVFLNLLDLGIPYQLMGQVVAGCIESNSARITYEVLIGLIEEYLEAAVKHMDYFTEYAIGIFSETITDAIGPARALKVGSSVKVSRVTQEQKQYFDKYRSVFIRTIIDQSHAIYAPEPDYQDRIVIPRPGAEDIIINVQKGGLRSISKETLQREFARKETQSIKKDTFAAFSELVMEYSEG